MRKRIIFVVVALVLIASMVPFTAVSAQTAAARVQVETKADGTGIVVPAQAIASGNSVTVYAISRDVSNNFIANVAADVWSLQNGTGGVVPADLAPSLDKKSAVFTGHAVGSAQIKATSGTLATTLSGVITVIDRKSGFSPWGWLQGLKKGWQGLSLPPGWFKNGKADQDDKETTTVTPQEKGNAKNNKNK